MSNAQAVIRANTALVELNKRGLTVYIPDDLADSANEKIAKAKAVLSGEEVPEEKVLSFDASIDFSSTKAVGSVTMTNTTGLPQDCVLVIVAYNGDKLVNLNIGEPFVLASGSENITKTISMNKESTATKYKVLIWESMDSLTPLGMSD